MLRFEQKAILHLAVALWGGLTAISHHQVLSQSHHWGELLISEATLAHLSLMRILLGVGSMLFWLMAVMSATMYLVQKRAANGGQLWGKKKRQ